MIRASPFQGRCYCCTRCVHTAMRSRRGQSESRCSLNFSIEGRNLSYSIVRDKPTSDQKTSLPILKDCSFRVPAGQLWMLLGPNGCGKSTLLKILAGITNPTEGDISIREPKVLVFQNPDHQVVMPTVEADVAFGLGKFNLPPCEVRSRVRKALETVNMLEYIQRPVQTLSGGQKQRVAIAGALAECCKVLLLDELTTFLDETDQIRVLEAIRNCIGGPDQVSALWVTHRCEELRYADGGMYMEEGRIILQADISSITNLIAKRKADHMNLINF